MQQAFPRATLESLNNSKKQPQQQAQLQHHLQNKFLIILSKFFFLNISVIVNYNFCGFD